MLKFSADTSSAEASIRLDKARLPTVVRSAVAEYGAKLLMQVKANASGRPGPDVITGQYRDSIQMDLQASGATATAFVFSDEPYAITLEYGGMSGGRGGLKVSRPYPHFRPALKSVGSEFEKALYDRMVL